MRTGLEEVGACRLQHIDVAQADRNVRELAAAQAEADRAAADRGFLQHVVRLHEDLHGQAGGQYLRQRGHFGRIEPPRVHAHEVIGEQRGIRRFEAIGSIPVEECAMFRLAIFAGDLEFSHRNRLGDCRQLREPLAVRGKRLGA